MASYTTNLNLKKPAGSENVAIGDINNNMDTIDQAYGTLTGQIANNYTDYNSPGNYHVRVCQSGKIVTVSGEIVGTGTAGYIDAIDLPAPFAADSQELSAANALVFVARNQSTGAYQQIRVGENFKIYREAGMPSGQWYAFGFSYCKA